MTDIERALLNPASVFTRPEEVLAAKDISRAQSKFSAVGNMQLQVAEEENMVGQRVTC